MRRDPAPASDCEKPELRRGGNPVVLAALRRNGEARCLRSATGMNSRSMMIRVRQCSKGKTAIYAQRPALPNRALLRDGEMLRQFQALPLVVRRASRAVQALRARGHTFVNEATHHLSMLQREGDLVATNLEHAAGA